MASNGKHNNEEPIHISMVLDRSGSMSAIASDIVGGFNHFLAEQRTQAGVARVTLAQFDSQDPFEVLIDGVDLREVTDLDRSAYRPRAMTPLYDAVGRMIAKVDADIAARAKCGAPAEDQVVVIITDGLENHSRVQTRHTIFEIIERRREDGWVFVFLGANQDVNAEGQRIAVSPGNRAEWKPTKQGIDEMWEGLSDSTTAHRMKEKYLRAKEADIFHQKNPKQTSTDPSERPRK